MSDFFASLNNPDTRVRRWMSFGTSQKRRTYSKLGQLVNNGLTITDSIEALAQQARERGRSRATIAAILSRWRRSMLNGCTFSEAVADDLPQSDVILLRAGESSGQLARAVESILTLWDAKKQMKSAIIGGLTYPMLLFCLVVLLMTAVAFSLVPTMADVIPRDKWQGMAHGLDVGSTAIITYGPISVVAFAILIAISIWSLPRWTGPIRAKFDSFMPWSLYKTYMGVGFLVAIAGLIREGVKTNQALEIVMDGSSPWYRERVSAALRRMEDGEKIATALHNTGFRFPDREIVDDMRVYENLDNFESNIRSLANDSLDVAISSVKAQMKIFQNIAIFAVGATIVWFYGGFGALMMQIGQPSQ